MTDMFFRPLVRPLVQPLTVLALASLAAMGRAADSSFTYQGHLALEGMPVTGVYDFHISLHDDPSTGSQVGASVIAEDVAVKEGLFQTPVDFGVSALDGASRWLEIAVRAGASTGSFRTLSPRTPLTRTPYAVHALKADEATTAAWALQAGMASQALHAGHATSAASAAAAGQVATAAFAGDAGTLDGQPAAAYAASSHTHTGATIDDGTIDAADLTSNPASLANVTGGAAFATADGKIGLGTTSPTEMLVVRGSVAVKGDIYLGHPAQGGMIYDPENGSLSIGEPNSGIDQQTPSESGGSYPVSGWQSFTAGVSGYLYRIELARGWTFASATVYLREGEGDGGSELTSGTLPATGGILQTWQSLEVSPPVWVSAGTVYSIHLDGHELMWIYSTESDPYPGGRSNFWPDRDFLFRTYVTGVRPHITLARTGDVTIHGELTVRGEAYKPGGGAWASLSDSRAKTSIATLPGALDKILQLRGVTFRWKDPAAVGARDSSPVMGLIADEVAKVFPQWVSRGPDGLRRLKMVGFEGLAVEALKEISSRHSEEQRGLEETLQSLEEKSGRLEEFHESVRTRLADLEARLGRLEREKAR